MVVVAIGTVTWLAVKDDGSSDVTSTAAISPTVPGRLEPAAEGIAEVGTTAPDFELTGLDGRTVRLSDFRGTPVVLNFWASWCTPCREEFPLLRTAARDADGAYAVVGVNTREGVRQDAKDFARDEHATWPNGFDADESVRSRYGVRALPQTIFIDADGTIVERLPRELNGTLLDRGIARAQRGAR